MRGSNRALICSSHVDNSAGVGSSLALATSCACPAPRFAARAARAAASRASARSSAPDKRSATAPSFATSSAQLWTDSVTWLFRLTRIVPERSPLLKCRTQLACRSSIVADVVEFVMVPSFPGPSAPPSFLITLRALGRQNKPFNGSHLKYETPWTVPSFLPAGSSNSTPIQLPGANFVSPTKRMVPRCFPITKARAPTT
mmetsp:Transcript_87441/g.245449  ORF Transcript_87441/g.245449 Transcript_87441/m.245449 type:complete len:200 (-) Transcript_87441:124-723(-)